MLKVLSLFAGIGGFDLGLERTGGFKTVAFCEIDPFCRRVLAKHWPGVPCYDDVRTLAADRLAADGIAVDVICGGFPCQDISTAGLGAGIEGKRSGLWADYARLIGELRPAFVIVENVSALLNRGLDRVLGDLAALGYDADWHCIPASAVGAPHRRDRIWIVANPCSGRRSGTDSGQMEQPGGTETVGPSNPVADAPRIGRRTRRQRRVAPPGEVRQPARPALAYTDSERGCSRASGIEDAKDARQPSSGSQFGQWDVEPNVGRVANGVPSRVDRLRALGNAVVPQIPELIGRAILEATT